MMMNSAARSAILAVALWQVLACVWPTPAIAAWTMWMQLSGGSDNGATTVIDASAAVSFGTANTIYGSQAPGAGERVRLASGGSGSHFVATLEVSIWFTDGPGCPGDPNDCVPANQAADIDFYQIPTASVPEEKTRWALGINEDWSNNSGLTTVPLSPGGPLQYGVDATSSPVTHQIAILMFDSDSAGPKSTSIDYLATANPPR